MGKLLNIIFNFNELRKFVGVCNWLCCMLRTSGLSPYAMVRFVSLFVGFTMSKSHGVEKGGYHVFLHFMPTSPHPKCLHFPVENSFTLN